MAQRNGTSDRKITRDALVPVTFHSLEQLERQEKQARAIFVEDLKQECIRRVRDPGPSDKGMYFP
jgi:hypothetical protein